MSAALIGRDRECTTLDQLLDDIRAGQSRVLVLRGDAGVGKSALLDYLSEHASGSIVARAAGVESELELPFAGLHQLCAPMLHQIDQLSPPQRDALQTAFGLNAGAPPDRFLVGLATLSLLADAAQALPLLCIVDDAQWLDRASLETLAFVARRLGTMRIATVFAVRSAVPDELHGLPELAIGGLSEPDAQRLLEAALPGPVDAAVRDAIVAESGGNPLALLELPRGLTPVDLAGGFRLPAVLPLPRRLEESFRRRHEALPLDTQRLVLVAAAEPTGNPVLLARAAHQLGIDFAKLSPAAEAGLLKIGVTVRFRHPLVRSAIYRTAAAAARAEAHLALAQATDPKADPDRRAWHRAQAAAAPDDAIADELEQSAARAHARGGLAAEAAFLERSAELTVDAAQRGKRLIAAAQAKQQAGAPEAALRLLRAAEAAPLDEFGRARIDLVRAQIAARAFTSRHARDAPALLLAAAQRLEPIDAALARQTYLDALQAALLVGRLAGDVGIPEVARAARQAPPSSSSAADLLLDGLALVFTEGYGSAAELLRKAVSSFRSDEGLRTEDIRWLWLATHAARNLWDDESWYALATRYASLTREAGAFGALPVAILSLLWPNVYAGDFDITTAAVDELRAVTEVTESRVLPYGELVLAAIQGREPDALGNLKIIREAVDARGEGLGLSATQHTLALMYNGLGRYNDALVAARHAAGYPEELGWARLVLPELVEAAIRSGDPTRAANAAQQLAETAEVSSTNWALGIEARARALVTDGSAAEALYDEAIARLGRTRQRFELARAHLLYGEWLRRGTRRVDARNHLQTAHDMLETMGADGFAERARRELLATGKRVRRQTIETRKQLTPQEAEIARLAATGLTNPEIARKLFLSPRTVEWHLRKVFMKLGISSRRQLRAGPAERARTRYSGP